MAKVQGHTAKAELYNGTTWVDVSPSIKTFSVDAARDASDVTSMDSDGAREFISGLYGYSISWDGLYDSADWTTWQLVEGDPTLQIRLYLGVGTGKPLLTFTLAAVANGVEVDIEGAVGISGGGTGSGFITWGTQA